MKAVRFSIFARTALAALALLIVAAPAAFAQEGDPIVIDEVVAQVNNDVITLSMVKREMKEAVEALKQQGKSEQDATAEIARRQPEIIASLINEQLLLQQGKELGLADDVEAEVNRRMLEVAKQQGIKTIAGLDQALRDAGLDPVGIRQTLRTEIMKQAVISREVSGKIFYGLSMDELKKYFEAHRDKFSQPETITLSEIFLSFAGKSEADVKAKADQIVAQARGGADFSALAVANSERMLNGKRVVLETKGLVGTFEVPTLNDRIIAAIKDVKAGGVTDPLPSVEGYQILRVDERVAGSSTPTFNENRVREAITSERSEQESKTYLINLRKDAYIKVAGSYREAVTPYIGEAITPVATPTNPPDKSDKKSAKSNGQQDKPDKKSAKSNRKK